MSEKKLNVKKTPTHEYEYSVKAGDQKARAGGSYKDDYVGWRGRVPRLGSPHPEDSTMGLVAINAKREEGNQIKVNLEYESYTWEATYPGRPQSEERIRRYDFEIATSEEPLLTHERFEDLDDAERVALSNLINGQETGEDGTNWADQVTSDLGLHALAKVRKGITHYLEPSFVWVERFSTKNLADIEIAQSGEIMDPPGNAPDPGTRTYLYLGCTGRHTEDGEYHEVERRWKLSGKGGWDDLYDPNWTLEAGGGG